MINELVGYSAIIAGFTVAVMSFYISQRYKQFSLSFVFLGASFLSYGVAELYYYLLDLRGVEPYQSAVDMLYLFYFVFAILHVLSMFKILRHHKFITTEQMVIVVVITSTLLAVYSIASYTSGVDEFSFIYGGLFVALASALAAFALITVIRVHGSLLTKSWILIGSAIFISSITDVWYYTAENVMGYEYGDPSLIDILYFATDILMIVGIILHWKKV